MYRRKNIFWIPHRVRNDRSDDSDKADGSDVGGEFRILNIQYSMSNNEVRFFALLRMTAGGCRMLM
jgi:hypothetical protein